MLGIIMRFTGLRLVQAAHIHWEDIDFEAGWLVVRRGKSRREKANRRRVAVSAHLLRELAAYRTDGDFGPVFPDGRTRGTSGEAIPIVSYRNQSTYLTRGWKEAIAAGEARLEAWNPSGRGVARPAHAFRAAFQGFLEHQGVADSVIDFLVGHEPRTTRARHYTSPHEDVQRRAVQLLPDIDWGEAPENVVSFKVGP